MTTTASCKVVRHAGRPLPVPPASERSVKKSAPRDRRRANHFPRTLSGVTQHRSYQQGNSKREQASAR